MGNIFYKNVYTVWMDIMKEYIFLLKILLFLAMLATPLRIVGKGYPVLYMLLALAMPMFIALITSYCLVNKRIIINNIYQIIVYFMAVFIWMTIGSTNGYSVIGETSSLCLMMLSLIAIVVSYNEKLISAEYIKNLAYLIMYCWSGAYALVALGMIFDIIPRDIFMNLIQIWLEANPNTAMDSGFLGLIPRLGSGENILPLIIYAYYLVDKRAGSICVWLMMFMFVLVDYGRIDMFFFVFLTMMFIYFKLKKRKISLQKSIMLITSLLTVIIFAYAFFAANNINGEEFLYGWTERYGRESTERYIQVKYLTEYITDRLWIGYGLGGYIPEYTRNVTVWLYEMEFHAFLMQMGIIGFMFIIVNYLVLFLRMVFVDINKRYKFITVACFLYWIVDSTFQGEVYFGVGRMICTVMFIFSRKERTVDISKCG